MMTFEEELEWWLGKVNSVEWTWAKTYAKTAPHWYIVEGRTEGMSHDDYRRAGRLIRRFGKPGKFWGYTNIYLEHGGKKWWTMDPKVADTDLINMADADQVYGVQDAPDTTSKHTSVYDSIGSDYDEMWLSPESLAENAAVRSLIIKRFGAYAPSTLDIGCGTGLLLDLGVTAASMYTGVDPSQWMLNELVIKHPRVKTLHPMTAEEFLEEYNPKPKSYELVVALFAAASYLQPETIERLAGLTSNMAVFMNYDGIFIPDYHNGVEPETAPAARQAALDVLNSFPGYSTKIGDFDVTVVER